MPQQPSKQFIARAGICLGIVVIILIVQTSWFRGLFKKADRPLVETTTTVSNLVDKDSNGNGILDWEERLWGLDPTVLYTNGVSHKEIIEQRRNSLSPTEGAESLNETDRLARELFVLATALGQAQGVDETALKQIGEKLGSTISVDQISNHYSLRNIKTVPTSYSSLVAYRANLSRTLDKYNENVNDIDIVISSLESGDYSRIGELTTSGQVYKKLAADLASINIPVGVAAYHLQVINGLYGMAESFTYLQEIEEGSVKSIAGIAIYKNYALRYEAALIDMTAYLTEYGIL